MHAYCLTVHARYRCGDSGVCCTIGWPIPLDADRVPGLRARGLIPRTTSAPAHVVEGRGENGERRLILASDENGCVFHDPHARCCRIHRDGGADLLPSACRDFPRVTLRDGRGIFITLSHLCPTAARLLLSASHIAIVAAPPGISLGGRVEGLDASGVLPPLLRPGMLLDLEGYAAWERAGVAVLNDRAHPVASALALIRRATDDVARWRPGGESLAQRVEAAFERARRDGRRGAQPRKLEHAARAYAASHLFASWAAYQDGGLHAVLDTVDIAHAAVATALDDEREFVEAVGAADLRLRHTPAPRPGMDVKSVRTRASVR